MAKDAPEIIRLTPSHGAAMHELHQASFTSGWPQEAFSDLLSRTHCLGLGVPQGGTPDPGAAGPDLFGFVLVSIVADEAEILTLAVAPNVRRRGIARALLEQATVSAKASGASSLFLEVSTDNTAAIGLYTTFGFEEVARRKGYYKSEGGADAVVMALRF